MTDKLSLLTRLQHAGTAPLTETQRTAPVPMPSMRTSTVRFKKLEDLEQVYRDKASGKRVVTYGRMGMDTHAELERVFCMLEDGARTFLASSGLGAISMVLLSLLGQNDHVIYTDNIYGPVRHLQSTVLERMGIAASYVPGNDIQAMENALQTNTKVLYAESPGSLLLEMLDLPALAKFAHQHNLILVVDNTWGSSWVYHPLQLGADISIVASTKYIGGHSDLMLGAAIVKDKELAGKIDLNQYALGYSVSADDVWLALRGTKTLAVRMPQHTINALKVCEFLNGLDLVDRIFYPAYEKDAGHALWKRDASGSNGLMSFSLKIKPEQARRFVNSLKLFSIGYSWGGYESLVQWVEESTIKPHAYWRNNTSTQCMRLHIGLENIDDLIADLQQALDQAVSVGV